MTRNSGVADPFLGRGMANLGFLLVFGKRLGSGSCCKRLDDIVAGDRTSCEPRYSVDGWPS